MSLLKKMIRTLISATAVLILLGGFMFQAASANPPSTPCAPGYHRAGGHCVKTDQGHPVGSKPTCGSDATPTKIHGGPNNGKWYCKPKPSAGLGGAKPLSKQSGVCDSGGCDLIARYVNPFISLLSIIVGLVAAISLILGGIQYITSTGDPQKTGAAKDRISKTILALIVFGFLYAFLNFLIPGGLF